MALLIASDLHKDMGGKPLLCGVSLKLERRERLTVAGRNGAGKTTLLRMLAGETSIDRGELSVAKGTRIALHDQRPPRERGMSLQNYLLSGCAEELQIEQELSELEATMAAGGAGEATLARYSRAQGRLEARGGYLWRDRATVMARGLGFADADLDRRLGTFSGRPPARWRWARRSTASGPRSRGWRGSSSASATRRPRLDRRSRGSRSSPRSSGSSVTPPTAGRSSSTSALPSARGG